MKAKSISTQSLKAKSTTTATHISRRELLNLALASPWVAALSDVAWAAPLKRSPLTQHTLARSPARIVPLMDSADCKQIEFQRQWRDSVCRSQLINRGREAVQIKEVVLCDLPLELAPQTRLYGEGFQMLSQTGGTLGTPVDLGNYTDAKHYKIPAPTDAKSFYGMMTLALPEGGNHVLAFTSCRRFAGQFLLRGTTLQIVMDTEGRELKPGERWEMEDFVLLSGNDREALLEELARQLAVNHPPLRLKTPPAGWCSWYCFGPRVTAQQVLDNLDFIARQTPGLRYIQIDDGYQPMMGDWLETGAAFGGNVQGVLKAIRGRGFEPAIWVAPFIAEEKSHLFQQHPEWFVKDATGKPLRSDTVTFGGWRRGPWYVLDGTHPEAQRHLETVFQTMRRDWGCTYFKLDANFWGAIHGGRFYDAHATRIEAYRRGMQAILRGAGDSFILGCNHPIWASLGLIHGSRSSNDIKRSWERIATTARQNLSRNWQNGRLWWNDPDAVVLTGQLSADELQFHATAIYASGGMILSGDDLTKISADRMAMLKKLQPPTGIAAKFTDDTLRVGEIHLPNRRVFCLFNWQEQPHTLSVRLPGSCEIQDYWTGQSLGRHRQLFTVTDMPPHSARLLVCTKN